MEKEGLIGSLESEADNLIWFYAPKMVASRRDKLRFGIVMMTEHAALDWVRERPQEHNVEFSISRPL